MADTVAGRREGGEAKKDNNNHNDPQGGNSDTESATETKVPAEPQANQGVLILDATCIPADIKYPTDLGLLNEARETRRDYRYPSQRGGKKAKT